jgi:alpha-N-arabinofuranosidase
MMKQLLTTFLGWLTISGLAGTPSFTVDASHSVGNVSPRLYGLMTEEINHSYDGGLYGELIQNRAFSDNAANPVHWSAVNDDKSTATIALDLANPLNDQFTKSLRVTVTKADEKNPAGVANDGYWGIPARPKTTYRAVIFAKAEPNFSGPVTVSIVSDDGKEVYATKQLSGLAPDWNKFEVTLKTGRVTPTAKAHFAITLAQPGTVWLGFVSLFPPTAKRVSQRSDAAAGGLAAKISALSGRQLRGRRYR